MWLVVQFVVIIGIYSPALSTFGCFPSQKLPPKVKTNVPRKKSVKWTNICSKVDNLIKIGYDISTDFELITRRKYIYMEVKYI